jgi:AraC-like DNA-binding protein
VEVAIIRQSLITYRVGSRTLEARPGDAIIVPAFLEHATSMGSRARAVSLHIGLELTTEIAESTDGTLPTDAVVLSDAKRLALLVDLLESEALRSDAGSRIASEALVEAIAVELLRNVAPKSKPVASRDPRVLAALHRIENDYASPLTIEDLAHTARMSRYHFSRVFRSQTGRSPYQALIETRVARAAERLRSGRTTVTEAALSTGFCDLGRFSRAFRRKMGTSPAAYASSRRRR